MHIKGMQRTVNLLLYAIYRPIEAGCMYVKRRQHRMFVIDSNGKERKMEKTAARRH